MGLGIRRQLRRGRVEWNLVMARALNNFLDFENVVLRLRCVDKESVEAILRHFGAKIGADCDIETGLVIHRARSDFANLTIGRHCHVGKDVFLDLSAPILIGDETTISMRVTFITHMDVGYAGPFGRACAPSAMSIDIDSRVYVGAGAIILPGVRLGAGSLIAAGALVNRDVPSRATVAGVPARVIRWFEGGAHSTTEQHQPERADHVR